MTDFDFVFERHPYSYVMTVERNGRTWHIIVSQEQGTISEFKDTPDAAWKSARERIENMSAPVPATKCDFAACNKLATHHGQLMNCEVLVCAEHAAECHLSETFEERKTQ